MRPDHDNSRVRPRKQHSSQTPSSPIGPSLPTSLFLRSERDMLRYPPSASADLDPIQSQNEDSLDAAVLEESLFGVQSLEDTLDEAVSHQATPLAPVETAGHGLADGRFPSTKRSRNTAHPRLGATAQYINSCDRSPARTTSISSTIPRDQSTSPFRTHLRNLSSTSRDHSFSPLGLNRRSASGIPGTPRSGSVRSLALSDEEGSMLDDYGSQVIHSSSEDEDIAEDVAEKADQDQVGKDNALNFPQLVMPSLSMPKRRPFTDRGTNMGRLKVLVMGPSGIGKTCLIRSVMQTCDDIVHVDPSITASTHSSQCCRSDLTNDQRAYCATKQITELNASTKAYPHWWSDMDEGKGLKRRRSISGAILDRNICFVDTPGWNSSGAEEHEHMQVIVDAITAYMEESFSRNVHMGQLEDSELLNSLSGGGGVQVDVTLYLFRPACTHISPAELRILRRLSSLTNLIPVIGKADTCSVDHIQDAKTALRGILDAAGVKTSTFRNDYVKKSGAEGKAREMPYAISSAVGDDSDIMDASLLMSPEYSQPLMPSDVAELAYQLFEPENIRWLRHCAVKKFLRWRRENLGTSIQSHKNELNAISLGHQAYLSGARTGSLLAYPPSGVLVPHTQLDSHSSEIEWSLMASRLATPKGSTHSVGSWTDMSESQTHMSVADWAQDLHYALDTERRRYMKPEKSREMTLCGTQDQGSIQHDHCAGAKAISTRAISGGFEAKGGASVVNADDPLGVLALGEELSRKGWLVLRILGGCSIFATVAVWMVRNWSIVTETLGLKPEVQTAYVSEGRLSREDWIEFFWREKW